MHYTILDCYTDEASGLGVPPYLGIYPRYIYGKLKKEGHSVTYLTIDDLRLWKFYKGIKKDPSVKEKTNILVYNTTKNNTEKVLDNAKNTDALIVIVGVHAPGKYLTAMPGTLKEVNSLIKDFKSVKDIKKNKEAEKIKNKKIEIILTGPVIHGTQLEGGRVAEKQNLDLFDEVKDFNISFEELETFAATGAELLNQIPDKRIIEIETSRGCKVGKCSFCTEPLKNRFTNRKIESVVKEIKAYYDNGARHFRLGKQADFYSSDRPIEMLKKIRKECPEIETLHIDNVNPNSVVSEKGEKITKAIVKYCTPGNIAAFGVESFDPEVVKANRLNTTPATAMKAIKLINKYGAERGEKKTERKGKTEERKRTKEEGNGMPKFLPGINLIFGLLKESKETHQKNMEALQQIMDEGLLLRRINIRQAAVFPGTYLEKKGGNKYLRKNKKYYWKWRNEIRQKIDYPMLKRLVPAGTVLENVYAEMYDGKTTFCRQMGSYPLIIGVKGRLPLGKKISVRVVSHMLRSIVGEVVE